MTGYGMHRALGLPASLSKRAFDGSEKPNAEHQFGRGVPAGYLLSR
jgi:hypothetical protein